MPGVKEAREKPMLNEFKTATMAELFIQQGHFDLAKDVLDNILKREPDNLSARLKLKKLELVQAPRHPLSAEKRLSVLNELERWLKKTEKHGDSQG